jgi:hypothetical protein
LSDFGLFIFRRRSVRTTASHPLVNFSLIEFPKPTDLVARHLPFTNPLVDRIPLDTEMVSNLIHGEPSVFHHSTPLTVGFIG